MKKAITLLSIIAFGGCSHFQTKQQIAQSLIKNYLDSILNDPHSYESVSFSKLDTGKTSFIQTPEWATLDTRENKIHSDLVVERVNLDYPTLYNKKRESEKIKKLMHDSTRLDNQMDSLEKNFKQVQDSWFISHTYRAKNGFGALGLHTTIFKIDTELKKILDAQEMKN